MKDLLLLEIEKTAKDLVIYSSSLVKNESMTRSLLEKLHNLENALYYYNKAVKQ